MKTNKLPSWDYLNECFGYDTNTGELFWKVRPLNHFSDSITMNRMNSKLSNTICGTLNNRNYKRTTLDNKKYLNHRIIWKLITKKDPPNLIDHIDGNPLNNKFSNLRKATNSENQKKKC